MANRNEPEAQETEQKIEDALTKSGKFIEDNSKVILIAFFSICVIVGLFFAYIYMYKAPREQEAGDKMYKAMEMYAMDSMELALNGNNEFMGLLEIAEEYSGTPQANIANHTIGICYMNLGKYEEAIKYFEAYKPVKDGFCDIVSAQNTGLMGDAYVQLGNSEKGMELYDQAVKQSDNSVTASIYLFKSANINYANGEYQKALDKYTEIRNKYPSSPYSRDIEKFISMASANIK